MGNGSVALILLLIALIIIAVVYAVLSAYLVVDGFVALFDPETYNLSIIKAVG